MKKIIIMMAIAVTCVFVLMSGVSQASIIYGSVWEDATTQSMNPKLGAPVGVKPTSTFYVNVADQIEFDSRDFVGDATYNQFLDNPVWTGTNIGTKRMDTYSGHGTFFQFTGYMAVKQNALIDIWHDDGFWLEIGNTSFDYSGPVSPTLATIKWLGTDGIYSFTLNYGAYNGYPEVLTTRGATFVPEPATMLLFGLGLLGLAGLRRKLKK